MDRGRSDTQLEGHFPQLTAAERAELEAENRLLIAKIKHLLTYHTPGDITDPGNMGVPHAEFLSGWDGVRLNPPSFSEPPA